MSSLTYNKDNSLATIAGAAVTDNLGGNITAMSGGCPTCYGTFSYDPRGNLYQSYTLVAGQWVTQNDSYDAFGRRYGISVTTGSGTTPLSYMYDGLNVVMAYNGSASIASLLGLGLDELYFENIAGVQSSVLNDALGSVVALTNSSKALTDSYTYDPYGATTTHSGTSLNTQQFAGQAYDFNSNLYNMRRRYYLPAIGRFISRDPIGLAGGINVYAYANDDPIDFSDPTGLCTSATYDGPSEAGEASEAGGSSIGTAASYAIAGDFAAINGGGVSIGVGIGGIGGLGSLRSGLLPDHGGAYPGGDVVLAYQGQNSGGLTPAQDLLPLPGEVSSIPELPATDLDRLAPGPSRPRVRATLNNCLNAAQNSYLWENFCNSLPTGFNSYAKQSCWSLATQSIQERINWCSNYFGTD